jgi:hypothetical protein
MARGLNSFESVFHQELVKWLLTDIGERAQKLGDGSARRGSDVSATGMAYFEEAAYIRALRDVIDHCKQIESDLTK